MIYFAYDTGLFLLALLGLDLFVNSCYIAHFGAARGLGPVLLVSREPESRWRPLSMANSGHS
jgi:hypothetical protein